MNAATLRRETKPKTAAEAREVQAAQQHLTDLLAKLRTLDAKIQKTGYEDHYTHLGEHRETARDKLGKERAALIRDIDGARGAAQQAHVQATVRLVTECAPEYIALARKLRAAADMLGKLLDEEARFVGERGLSTTIGHRADWPEVGLYTNPDTYRANPLRNFTDKLDRIIATAEAEESAP